MKVDLCLYLIYLKVMYPRNVIKEIKKYINTDDVIVLHGARQVGKTTIMKMVASDLPDSGQYYIDLEDSRFLTLCNSGSEEVFSFLTQKGYSFSEDSKFYLFIDEIQYLDDPSSFLKLIHDHYKQIKLFVSGSSSFDIKKKFKDSLVGRTVDFEIFPLSFSEFLKFKESKIDLSAHITSDIINSELQVLYKEFVLYGGYPKIVTTEDTEKKERYLQQIIDTYIKKDIRDLANVKYVDRFNKLLHVLAQQSGSLLNITELSNTTKIARQTIEEYLFILENTYIIKLVQPYHNNVRSELFKTPKVFFYDTGILSMLWLKMLSREYMGNIFETSVFAEFVKLLGREKVNYWRTQDKKEIDFIIQNKTELLPFEVKLNANKLSKTALNYFCSAYNVKKMFCVHSEGAGPGIENLAYLYPWNISSIF